mgnify:CR=1 FL=1
MSISSFCACFPVGYRIRNAWRRSRKQSRHVACLIHYLSFCCVTFHAFENLRSSYVCDLWSGRASYFLSLSCSLVVVLFFLHLFASLVFCVGSRSCTLDSWKRGRNSSLRSAPCRLIIMLTSRFEGIIPLSVTSGLSSHMGCFILWWFPLSVHTGSSPGKSSSAARRQEGLARPCVSTLLVTLLVLCKCSILVGNQFDILCRPRKSMPCRRQ